MSHSIRTFTVGFVVAVLAGCGGHKESATAVPSTPRVNAPLLEIAKAPIATRYEAIGTIRAKTSSSIQSKATGHIIAFHVHEGDAVKAGQLLLELDDRDVAARVQGAEAALREAQQARDEIASVAQAAVHARTAAEASGSLAAATYERYKGLVDKNAVSRQAFDEATSRRLGAEAEVARASDMASSVQARRGEVEARIERAQADLTAAKTAMTYTRITAPYAGVVTRKAADIGDLAAPGMPLLELDDPAVFRLEAVVDEAHASRIRMGDAVAVALDALDGDTVTGAVTELAPTADTASRSFVVKIDLPNDPKIRTGMFGRAQFAGAEQQLLTIPAGAIVRHGQLTTVYVVGDDNIARLRLITTGRTYGNTIEALSGLSAGERIVASNLTKVTDGCVVDNG